MTRTVLVWVVAAALVGVAIPDAPLQGQQEGEAGDTLRGDTLTAQDSARIRVQQRLRSLSAPPGTRPDTARLDTATVQGARSGRGGRPMPTPGGTPGDSIAAALLELPGYTVTRYEGAGAEFMAREEILLLFGEEGLPDRMAAAVTDTASGDTIPEPPRPDTLVDPPPDTVPPERLLPDTAQPQRPDTLLPWDTVVVAGDTTLIPADTGRDPGDPRAPAGDEQPTRAVLSGADGYVLEAGLYIRYDQRRQTAAARGRPRFTSAEGGDPVEADSLNIDVAGERASAFEARTRYAAGGGTDWNVTGNLPLVGEDVIYGDHTRFTSCDLEVPHYHFETDQLKIVAGRIMVARPVRLYFADVPVAWLPFVAQSLSSGRASGLLTPRFSVNDIVRTSGSYRRRISNVGFYWAMNDYMDATVAFDWFSDNYTAMTGSWRYRWLRQFLNGSVNVRRFWPQSGGTQLTFDTQHRWEISERTRFNMSARYASSTSFVRRNSFDPREITQDINSEGGLSHRFDWGSLNLSARRKQSLSTDAVEQTLPNLSLSLNTLTFFDAPPNRASWYNNLTWSGGGSLNRQTRDRAQDTLGFSFSRADVADLQARVNSTFSLGRFSLSQSLSLDRGSTFGVPVDSLIYFPDAVASQGMLAFEGGAGRSELAQTAPGQEVDITQSTLSWSNSLSFQQNLIGSTTFTPRLQVSGRALRSDTMELAQTFVSAPNRISFGAQLKADVYGFYPGFGGFTAIRHKFSPTFSYDWAPPTEPTELQQSVFGARAAQPQSVLQVGFNQTWEAKRRPPDEDEVRDSLPENPPPGGEPAGIDQTPPDLPVSDATTAGDETGPRRLEEGEIVNLLSVSTSLISYDFVEADSVGSFLHGFTSTTLRNQISSDFLPGLNISMTHDLFDDQPIEGVEGVAPRRRLDPHLRSLNFGFNLNPNSGLVRWLGLGTLGGRSTAQEDELEDEPYEQRSATDESTVLPGRGTERDVRDRRRVGGGAPGAWSTRFSYSLNRPRAGGPQTSQMMQIAVNLNPTQNWEMSWDTGYDLEDTSFTDHRIRLTRDLHRWQAHFDFLKTATGNWTFRFEVSLLDNQDLRFEHEQRNLRSLTEGR